MTHNAVEHDVLGLLRVEINHERANLDVGASTHRLFVLMLAETEIKRLRLLLEEKG